MSVNVIYKTHATATGGRDGSAKSDDGSVDVKLVVPKELGGPGGVGANPESSSRRAIRPASSAR